MGWNKKKNQKKAQVEVGLESQISQTGPQKGMTLVNGYKTDLGLVNFSRLIPHILIFLTHILFILDTIQPLPFPSLHHVTTSLTSVHATFPCDSSVITFPEILSSYVCPNSALSPIWTHPPLQMLVTDTVSPPHPCHWFCSPTHSSSSHFKVTKYQ